MGREGRGAWGVKGVQLAGGTAIILAMALSRGVATSRATPGLGRRAGLALMGGAAGAAAAGAPGGRGRNWAQAASVGSPVEILEKVEFPAEFPFSARDFARYDESADALFYQDPRFVTHIDDKAIAALTSYYDATFPPAGDPDVAILDLCSSWISHFPEGYSAGRIAGLGMNEAELARNPVLTEYAVKDLNTDPVLPYADSSFDFIVNAVSVDYLNKPLEVFREMHRVLKPGGTCAMSFSNRCFPTKAVSIWTSTGDMDHIFIVGSYFHYSVPGGFAFPRALDISPKPGLLGKSDPMYVVFATKTEEGGATA